MESICTTNVIHSQLTQRSLIHERRFSVSNRRTSSIVETSESRSQEAADTGTMNTVLETVRNPPTADPRPRRPEN
jgi:hypothetical protein